MGTTRIRGLEDNCLFLKVDTLNTKDEYLEHRPGGGQASLHLYPTMIGWTIGHPIQVLFRPQAA